MIAHLSGKLIHKTPTCSILDCQGVGYEVFHTPFTASQMLGERVNLHIHTQLREDALQLYGFSSPDEKELFRELLRVSSVGPKLALSILSGLPHEELLSAIQSKDIHRLQKIPGIGKKTAERILIELGDRLSKNFAPRVPGSSSHLELESILVNLGYQKNEVSKVIGQLPPSDLGLEVLVKTALRELTGSKERRPS